MRPVAETIEDTGSSAPSTSRRGVLKALGATGAAAAAFLAGTARSRAQTLPTVRVRAAQRFVYRLTTRGRRACKACKIHHRYVIGATPSALDDRRAHPGCNCPIVRQIVTAGEFGRLFPKGSGTVDLRRLT